MLSIEYARKQELALPPELATRMVTKNDGREDHCLALWGRERDLDRRTLGWLPFDRPNEWIPLWIAREVEQHGPYLLRSCSDCDRRLDLVLHVAPNTSVQPAPRLRGGGWNRLLREITHRVQFL